MPDPMSSPSRQLVRKYMRSCFDLIAGGKRQTTGSLQLAQHKTAAENGHRTDVPHLCSRGGTIAPVQLVGWQIKLLLVHLVGWEISTG